MVHEDNETISVTIRTNVPGGPPAGSVAFTTVNGTALGEKAHSMLSIYLDYVIYISFLDSSDYVRTFTTLSFETGSYITTVDIPIINDDIGELQEVFYGMLSIIGSSNIKITQDQAEIHIIDDDGRHYINLNDDIIKKLLPSTVRVWFEPTSYTVDESDGTVTLIVMTNVPGGPSNGEVEFYTVNGTATSKASTLMKIESLTPFLCTGAGDFKEVLGFHVNFDEGSYNTTVMVTVNEDGILENDEVFFGRLRLIGVERIEITEDEASVTITDNDCEYT